MALVTLARTRSEGIRERDIQRNRMLVPMNVRRCVSDTTFSADFLDFLLFKTDRFYLLGTYFKFYARRENILFRGKVLKS